MNHEEDVYQQIIAEDTAHMMKPEIETDLFVKKIRDVVTRYYNEIYREDKVTEASTRNVAAELTGLVRQYLKNQLAAARGLNGELRELEKLVSEVQLAARRFLFLVHQFRIEAPLSLELDFSFSSLLKQFQDTTGSAAKGFKQRLLDAWEESILYFEMKEASPISGMDVYEAMLDIAKSLSTNMRSDSEAFDHESVLEMTDVLTDYLWENQEDDCNEAVTAFAVFNHLIKDHHPRCKLDSSFYRENVYCYLDDEDFVDYLELIRNRQWKKAMEQQPEYSIPYYYTLVSLFVRKYSPREINETIDQHLPLINECLGNAGDLFHKFPENDEYLPSLDVEFVTLLEAMEERTNYLQVLEAKNKKLEAQKRKLEEQKQELERLNKELLLVNHKNRKMVDDFSHSWTNILKPDLVYHAAKALMGDERYRKQYIALMRAYNDEVLAGNECQMLKLTHSDYSKESRNRLRHYLREGIVTDKEKGIDVRYILNYALNRTLFRLFFEKENERIRFIQKQFEDSGIEFSKRSQAFEQFLHDSGVQEPDVIKWFNQDPAFFAIEICMDDNWREVRLDKNKGVTTFLITRFMELFINMFTYGSKRSEDSVYIRLFSTQKEFYDFLAIRFENSVGPQQGTSGFSGSQRGLLASQEIFKMLHADLLRDDSTVFQTGHGENHRFYVEMLIDQYLLKGE
ncbi:hypothetical protein [Neobacillus sp. Marseille-QA0830]